LKPESEKPGTGKSETDFRLYWLARLVFGSLMKWGYRIEWVGLENVPEPGGALFASSHGSFLDVPAIGACIKTRPVCFVARASLIRIPILGWFIRHWGPILIQRGAADVAALRAMATRAKAGELVTIFPEGTRTPDGHLQELRQGVLLAARLARVPVIPVGIVGAFEGFPRTRKFPKLWGKIVVSFGPPIPLAELSREADDALPRLRVAIAAQIDRAGQLWSRSTGKPFRGALRETALPQNRT